MTRPKPPFSPRSEPQGSESGWGRASFPPRRSARSKGGRVAEIAAKRSGTPEGASSGGAAAPGERERRPNPGGEAPQTESPPKAPGEGPSPNQTETREKIAEAESNLTRG